MVKWIMASVIAAVVLSVSQVALGATEDLQGFFKDHSAIKICVELKNSSGDQLVDVAQLKKLIENAFAARKSNRFTVVPTAAEADLVLTGDVTEYVWTAEDPIDEVWGVGSAAMDAAMIENYARIKIQSALIATKRSRTLWSDSVMATMTQKIMPKDESYGLVYSKFVKTVMIEIFKKRSAERM